MSADASRRLVLFDYWRSTACYRVRIALRIKGLDYEPRPVDLVRDGGEQHMAAYREINPHGLVPALVHDDRVMTQSLAACEYLDEVFPAPPLLPAAAADRARVRAMALAVACDVHPLNNLRVQQYLKGVLGATERQVVEWMHHWMAATFSGLEKDLQSGNPGGACCWGDEPGLADCCLIPQVYNADRFGFDMSGFPRIGEIVAHCRSLPAFRAAVPERQPGAPNR